MVNQSTTNIGEKTQTKNGLAWHVKESFVTYIAAMRDGQVSTAKGAERLADGRFFFPLRENSGEGASQRWAFDGSVHFTGHHGMLAVNLDEVRVRREGAAHILSIADSDMPDGRLDLVSLGDGEAGEYPAPTLTEDGADLFFGNYREGTAFDALELRIGNDS